MAGGRNGRTVYRTMQGKTIDMDLLRKKNEMTPAVGNAKMNARGDILGPGGKVIKKREDVAKEYYKTKPVVDERPAPAAAPAEQPKAETTTTAKKTTTRAQQKVETAAKPTASELKEFDDMDDGWVEDADGNFVKKGE